MEIQITRLAENQIELQVCEDNVSHTEQHAWEWYKRNKDETKTNMFNMEWVH